MRTNPWLKLAAVSFAGIVLSYAVLWGTTQLTSYSNNNMYSMSYNNGMNMQGNVSMQGNMNMQSNMNTQSSSNSSMGMMDDDMNMMDDDMMGNMNSSQSSMMMDMGM